MQPVFGRCEYFFFVDPDSMAFEAEPNPYASASEKAGQESAELIIGKGAKIVLTSQVGVKARQVLDAAGVEIVSIEGNTVREAMETFRERLSARAGD
jgi:predicted Fe-Mo cluster-binding NifX family protein